MRPRGDVTGTKASPERMFCQLGTLASNSREAQMRPRGDVSGRRPHRNARYVKPSPWRRTGSGGRR
jgi:hypothetical protein